LRALLEALRKRHEDEEGFTLIELMVVVLIIAILIAIAIPTFLGAQDRARDRGAQADLRNAITAAKTVATDNEGLFFDAEASQVAALAEAEPSLKYQGSGAATEKTITVTTFGTSTPSGAVGTGFATGILLNRLSASGTMFCIQATREGAVTYGRNEAGANIPEYTGGAVGSTCGNAKF
jgi:type IV pilus assembly protein PilA